MTVRSPGVRRFSAVAIYVLAVGWGVHAAIDPNNSLTQWVISLGLAVTCTVWCATDAAARGRDLVWPARIGIFLFWPAGVLIYLVWSRGPRGLLMAIVAGIAWLATMFAAFMAAGYAAYGPAWFGRPP